MKSLNPISLQKGPLIPIKGHINGINLFVPVFSLFILANFYNAFHVINTTTQLCIAATINLDYIP